MPGTWKMGQLSGTTSLFQLLLSDSSLQGSGHATEVGPPRFAFFFFFLRDGEEDSPFIYVFLYLSTPCGICNFLDQGPALPAVESPGVLTTGPPGKPPASLLRLLLALDSCPSSDPGIFQSTPSTMECGKRKVSFYVPVGTV